MNLISISIITPSYNSSLLISNTIKSVLAQTVTDWEMIIVDDCSSDNSVDVIQSFVPVLFMRALKVTHFRQLDDPLTIFGLEGTIFGSVFTLSA